MREDPRSPRGAYLPLRGLSLSSPLTSARGVSPTHPNKGTNDFNYGVIAESGVN